jgi:uncharacterized protein YjbJ (UPF0337 family)
MNKDIVKGYWNGLKGKLEQRWAEFTANDLPKMKAAYEKLRGELEEKYTQKKQETKKELDEKKDKVAKNKKDKD